MGGAAASRLLGVVCTAACCALLALGLAGPHAALGASWSIESTPSLPPSAQPVVLGSVSCASRTFCVAVGRVAGRTLTERWNGVAWKVQRTPVGRGALFAELNDISCTSRTACIAVGDVLRGASSATRVPLAERWNGGRWVILRVPNAGHSTGISGRQPESGLQGVSCISMRACIAVGGATVRGGFGVAAERWNGSRWTILPIPSPAPSPAIDVSSSSLYDVSCSSSRACSAVGDIIDVSGDRASLAERWNGSKWVLQRTPSSFLADELLSVSCPTATSCVAVGDSGFPDVTVGSQTLAIHWNGTRWSIKPTPNVPDVDHLMPQGSLSGVSCISRADCTAVGSTTDLGSVMAEHWNGFAWSLQAIPSPVNDANSSSALNSVSCTSSTTCIAVGSLHHNRSAALAEGYF